MRCAVFLVVCVNVADGVTSAPLSQGRPDASKRLRGLHVRSAHNSTNGTVASAEHAQLSIARSASDFRHERASRHEQQPNTNSFRSFYDNHMTGRGVWKWANALDAYDRHFQAWKGQSVMIAEVGVQSGGSILMWQGVLGSQIQTYGFDINPNCKKFEAPGVVVTIGDQGDPAMWKSFFSTVTPSLDILIDDGGHEPEQMLTTLYEVYPHISSGGFLVIEDIHGQHYGQSFFAPAAQYLGQQASSGWVDSVHVYPFLLVVQKSGPSMTLPAANLEFAANAPVVDSFEALWAALPQNPGGTIVLRNPTWGPFLTSAGLVNFFAVFIHLHDYGYYDAPPGCATTSAAICTNVVQNSLAQAAVSGIHIYNDRLVVEVPATPPLIQAVRRGTEWQGYGL